MLELSLQQTPFVLIDFETTGLYPHRGDRVCEVALLRLRGTNDDLRYESLIDPECALSEQAFNVNHIGPADLAGAPRFAAVADLLRVLCAGSVLVAHNAPFDMEFLHAELARAQLPPFELPVIDTLVLARRLFPRRASHSLRALALNLGAEPPSHRAMDDVLALQVVFADMLVRLESLGIHSLGALLRYSRGFNADEPAPALPPLIELALHEGQLLRVVYRSRSLPDHTERVIRPIAIVKQHNTLFLQAYCYLRHDLRAFALDKLTALALAEPGPLP